MRAVPKMEESHQEESNSKVETKNDQAIPQIVNPDAQTADLDELSYVRQIRKAYDEELVSLKDFRLAYDKVSSPDDESKCTDLLLYANVQLKIQVYFV